MVARDKLALYWKLIHEGLLCAEVAKSMYYYSCTYLKKKMHQYTQNSPFFFSPPKTNNHKKNPVQ